MALLNILVDIAASTARLETGLKAAEARIGEFTEKVTESVKRVAEFAGVALTFEAIAESIKHAIEAGDQLQLLSQRMGVSVETLSQLKFVAASLDIPFDVLTGAIDHLHLALGRAELAGGRSGKALAAMGIDAKKLLDLPFEQQLTAIADRLSRIENPSQRAAREMIFFGEAGVKLDPLLRQGAAGIQRLLEEAEKAGVTIDGKMTQKLKELHEEIVKTDQVTQAATLSIAAGLSPAIASIAGFLAKAVQGLQAFGTDIAHYFVGGADVAKRLQDELSNLAAKYRFVSEDIRRLEQKDKGFGTDVYAGAIARRRQELAQIAAEMNRVNGELATLEQRSRNATKPAESGSPDISKEKPLQEIQTHNLELLKIYGDKTLEMYEKFDADTAGSVDKQLTEWVRLTVELDTLRNHDLISYAEYQKRYQELSERFITPLEVTAKKILKDVTEEMTEMEQLGDRAARSIQSAFAEFLFNPFHGGLKRMVLEFLQSLQRMAADAAAAQIFKYLFGGSNAKGGDGGAGLGGILGGVLSSIVGAFGGGRAGGGDVQAGSTYLVGERGVPELFTASTSGSITPLEQAGFGGDMHFHTNIDARGADADRIMTLLPPILAIHEARIKSSMLTAFRRSGLPAPNRA